MIQLRYELADVSVAKEGSKSVIDKLATPIRTHPVGVISKSLEFILEHIGENIASVFLVLEREAGYIAGVVFHYSKDKSITIFRNWIKRSNEIQINFLEWF